MDVLCTANYLAVTPLVEAIIKLLEDSVKNGKPTLVVYSDDFIGALDVLRECGGRDALIRSLLQVFFSTKRAEGVHEKVYDVLSEKVRKSLALGALKAVAIADGHREAFEKLNGVVRDHELYDYNYTTHKGTWRTIKACIKHAPKTSCGKKDCVALVKEQITKSKEEVKTLKQTLLGLQTPS
jgi:hypothetical protein